MTKIYQRIFINKNSLWLFFFDLLPSQYLSANFFYLFWVQADEDHDSGTESDEEIDGQDLPQAGRSKLYFTFIVDVNRGVEKGENGGGKGNVQGSLESGLCFGCSGKRKSELLGLLEKKEDIT